MVDEKLLGRTYGPAEHEVTEEEVQAFLDATDDETAVYGTDTDVAPPMIAVVYGREIVADMFFDEDLELDLPRLVHGMQSFDFHEPVRIGETVTTEGRIAEWRTRGDNEIIALETTSTVDGETRTTGRWTFVIRGGS